MANNIESKDGKKIVNSEESSEKVLTENKPEQKIPINENEGLVVETEKKTNKFDSKIIEKKSIEQKEKEVITVEDFIDYLESFGMSMNENDPEKGKVATQIIKIKTAIFASGINPSEVKVEKMSDNTLGLYDRNSNEISISKELMEDFNASQSEIRTTLEHENVHKINKIFDEGLAHKKTKQKYSQATNAYEESQDKAQRAFYQLGINKAMELYKIDDPNKLFAKFLKIGLEHKYSGQDKKVNGFVGNNLIERLAAKIRLDIAAEGINSGLVHKFKEAVPVLFEALEQSSVDILKSIKIGLRELALDKRKKS